MERKNLLVLLFCLFLVVFSTGCISVSLSGKASRNATVAAPTSAPANSGQSQQPRNAAPTAASVSRSSGGKAYIQNVQMSTMLDENAYPVDPRRSFLFGTDEAIAFSGDLTGNVRAGLDIRFDFYYKKTNELIGSQSFVAQGNETRVWMIINPPDGGWVAGDYKCRMFLDGDHLRDLHWTVG